MASEAEVEAAAKALAQQDQHTGRWLTRIDDAKAALIAAEKVREADWQREIDAIHEAAWNLVTWADKEEPEIGGNSGKALEGLRAALNRECPVCDRPGCPGVYDGPIVEARTQPETGQDIKNAVQHGKWLETRRIVALIEGISEREPAYPGRDRAIDEILRVIQEGEGDE